MTQSIAVVAGTSAERKFRPLVIGSPRSGFTLLCSVVIHFAPLLASKWDLRQKVLNRLMDAFGGSVAERIVAAFAAAGVREDLIYNENFRLLTGGPKWLSERDPEEACFRKYLGVRGLGDFSLVTAHPRQILDRDKVLHSHSAPAAWPAHPGYADCTRFASVRNPIGCINSSFFSINALTSEYIQRFLPEAEDDHALRERLALYKFTNLDFFEGLVRFYRSYFEEFMAVRDRYIVMRWEDLITRPQETILALARAADVPLMGERAPDELAASIWRRLDHVNLTGAHKHNFRRGGGIVGDWRNWMTNEHLEIIRGFGFAPIMKELGYDPIPTLDEDRYTPFQRRVAELRGRGEVFDDYPDRALFGFAFNKSNIESSKFPFKRYDWKQATKVERADFADEALMQEVWEAADAAVVRLNGLFDAALSGDYASEGTARAAVRRLAGPLADFAGGDSRQALAALEGEVDAAFGRS